MEQESVFDIEEELKKLPGQPGVYIMHDASDEIIYVGKAISLKNRVRQYFQRLNRWFLRLPGLSILSRIRNWKLLCWNVT